jgi:hypothetical protein
MSVKLSRRAAIGGTVAACLGAAVGVVPAAVKRQFASIRPGDWDDPATWKDGAIPPDDGRHATIIILDHVVTFGSKDGEMRTMSNHTIFIGESPHWVPCHGGLWLV